MLDSSCSTLVLINQVSQVLKPQTPKKQIRHLGDANVSFSGGHGVLPWSEPPQKEPVLQPFVVIACLPLLTSFPADCVLSRDTCIGRSDFTP